ncbi:MAG: hypothetical protein SFY69_11015 [Planctomycetota bacterium]|nr:hypothetical protein [Planctomycetota bacterium]
MRTTTWRRTTIAALGGLCVIGTVLPACNILGPAYIIAKGEPKTPAMHTLERERMTLFFVDDRGSHLPRQTLRRTIAQTAGDVLLEKRALTQVRDPGAGLAVASGENRAELLDAATIGSNAQAEVIVLISVKRFQLTSDRQSIEPYAKVLVRVVDCVNPDGVRWPAAPSAGYELEVRMTPPATNPVSMSEVARLEEDFAKRVGLSVARLFFEYETERGIGAK